MMCDVCKKEPREGIMQENFTVTEAEKDSASQAMRTVSEFEIMTAQHISVFLCRECFIKHVEKKRAGGTRWFMIWTALLLLFCLFLILGESSISLILFVAFLSVIPAFAIPVYRLVAKIAIEDLEKIRKAERGYYYNTWYMLVFKETAQVKAREKHHWDNLRVWTYEQWHAQVDAFLRRFTDVAGLLNAFNLAEGHWGTRELIVARLGLLCRDASGVNFNPAEMRSALKTIATLSAAESSRAAGNPTAQKCLLETQNLLDTLEETIPVDNVDVVELTRNNDISGLLTAFNLVREWKEREFIVVAFGVIRKNARSGVDYNPAEMASALRSIIDLCNAEKSGGSYKENCITHAEMLLSVLDQRSPA